MSMSRRSRFNAALRRRRLSFQVADRLDQTLEGRWAAVPFGTAALAITAVPALGQADVMHALGGVKP
jgi:hypothetical protein